ncbi:MAG: hypothetical protein AB8G22_20455 [Saprospiraceae bacterium]
MNLPTYDISQIEELTFSFISTGVNGKIKKIIKYSRLNEQLFNLAFGDQIKDSAFIDDNANSNNGDLRKVLATVISTIPIFFEKHPRCAIYLQGSDNRRTRTYQRIIKNYRKEFGYLYLFYGGTNAVFEQFDEEKDYSYFVIFKN